MDPKEAREHLDLVDRILTETDRSLYVIGDIFLAWGLVSAMTDVVFQLAATGRLGGAWLYLPPVGLAFAIVYTILRVRIAKNSSERLTAVGREYINVLWVVFGLTAVAQVGAFHLFGGWPSAALWTLAAAIVTFYIALHGDRAAMLGGCVLVASLIAASFMPQYVGYVLGAGMLIGYAGFGAASMATRA